MISYDLTLQLEQANFPYDENCLYPTNQPIGQTYPMTRVPPLSELIEACGIGFHKLVNLSPISNVLKWGAEGYKEDKTTVGVFGAKPDEAVAKLWLALNKK